jgi:hypothetical protein
MLEKICGMKIWRVEGWTGTRGKGGRTFFSDLST